MDRHWQRIARELFEAGVQERDVMDALRRQGAKSYMAADAVKATRRHYRNAHHMAHRKHGLRALAAGLCLWGLAGLIVFAAMGGWGAGHLLLAAGSLFVSGIMPVLLGVYKMLSGSSVAVVLPEDLR